MNNGGPLVSYARWPCATRYRSFKTVSCSWPCSARAAIWWVRIGMHNRSPYLVGSVVVGLMGERLGVPKLRRRNPVAAIVYTVQHCTSRDRPATYCTDCEMILAREISCSCAEISSRSLHSLLVRTTQCPVRLTRCCISAHFSVPSSYQMLMLCDLSSPSSSPSTSRGTSP